MESERQLAVAEGLRAGSPEAWHALYDAHAERLWHWVARRMGGRSADVADVIQETFLAAARSAAQFDAERGSLWLWLVGIARNHVALHYRREERHTPAVHADRWRFAGDGRLQRWLDGADDSPMEALESAELRGLVRVVLSRLSTDYETLLTARYLEGTPVEDLARDEATTVTAIRSKLARARQAFRDALAGMSDRILETLNPDAAVNETSHAGRG
jgi:RNA polymerase sigma-70 factor (ECF subfamily)